MIPAVDAHVHLWPSRKAMPDEVWRSFHWTWGRTMFAGCDPEEVGRRIDAAQDPAGAGLVAEMDEGGVLASVVMPMDFGLAVGEARWSIEEKNERIAAIAAASDGRIRTFCGVDPRRPGAAALLRRALEDWGAIGLKLYPPTGFAPDDPVVRPLYEIACDAGVPVLFHCGVVGYPLKSRYARPSEIDGVAAEFPRLRIVLGHIAYGVSWLQEALDVAQGHPNLLVEASGLLAVPGRESLGAWLRRTIDALGPDRLLFGSDRVGFPGGGPGPWLDVWRTLDRETESGPAWLTTPELEAALHGNANREYRLDLALEPPDIPVWGRYEDSAVPSPFPPS